MTGLFVTNGPGVLIRLKFSTERAQQRIDWARSQRLTPGTLIVLTIAREIFKTAKVAIVVNRTPEGLERPGGLRPLERADGGLERRNRPAVRVVGEAALLEEKLRLGLAADLLFSAAMLAGVVPSRQRRKRRTTVQTRARRGRIASVADMGRAAPCGRRRSLRATAPRRGSY